jgi:hypothetical protein
MVVETSSGSRVVGTHILEPCAAVNANHSHFHILHTSRLFAIAASHGDVRCLMSLGWLFTAAEGGKYGPTIHMMISSSASTSYLSVHVACASD